MFFKIFFGIVGILLMAICADVIFSNNDTSSYVNINTESKKDKIIVSQPLKKSLLEKDISQVLKEVERGCMSYMMIGSVKICVPQGIPVEPKLEPVASLKLEGETETVDTANLKIFSKIPEITEDVYIQKADVIIKN